MCLQHDIKHQLLKILTPEFIITAKWICLLEKFVFRERNVMSMKKSGLYVKCWRVQYVKRCFLATGIFNFWKDNWPITERNFGCNFCLMNAAIHVSFAIFSTCRISKFHPLNLIFSCVLEAGLCHIFTHWEGKWLSHFYLVCIWESWSWETKPLKSYIQVLQRFKSREVSYSLWHKDFV